VAAIDGSHDNSGQYNDGRCSRLGSADHLGRPALHGMRPAAGTAGLRHGRGPAHVSRFDRGSCSGDCSSGGESRSRGSSSGSGSSGGESGSSNSSSGYSSSGTSSSGSGSAGGESGSACEFRSSSVCDVGPISGLISFRACRSPCAGSSLPSDASRRSRSGPRVRALDPGKALRAVPSSRSPDSGPTRPRGLFRER